MGKASIKIWLYHFMLVSTSLLTVMNSVYLIMMVLSNENKPRVLLSGRSIVLFMIISIMRLAGAFFVMLVSYWFGTSYHLRKHLWGHSLYLLMTFIILFALGTVLNYQQTIWSLVLQIVHLYSSLIYTFKSFLYHEDDSLDAKLDFGRRPAELEDEQTTTWSLDKAIQRSRYGKILYFINKNLMAISTMVMIVLSILVSILLRQTISTSWSERNLMKLKFIGEIFIRVLLSLIVPLIGTSIAYACTAFDPKFSGRIMCEMITYYLATTTLATIEGLILVTAIAPGERTNQTKQAITATNLNQSTNHTEQREQRQAPPMLIEDTILDMVRNIFTDSLFQSWISMYHTKLSPPTTMPSSDIEHWHISGEQVPGANVMSVVMTGLLIGLSANMLRTRGGRIICDLIEAFNTIMMMVTLSVVQTAPVCTFFLIVPQILSVNDLSEMFRLVAWFTLTVLLALSIHCLLTLSAIYVLMTGNNPYRFLGQMLPAISTAFATSSSSASMSVTMQCLEESVGVPANIVRFIIPFGSTVNMDGAALYESVAAIFVAQYRAKRLQLAELITIAMTSILVSIGAAGIPQAGMITTVVVLNSIGLSLQDAALVMVVDFMLDRFRTVVNVLGDAFGAAVVNQRLRNVINIDHNKKANNEFSANMDDKQHSTLTLSPSSTIQTLGISDKTFTTGKSISTNQTSGTVILEKQISIHANSLILKENRSDNDPLSASTNITSQTRL